VLVNGNFGRNAMAFGTTLRSSQPTLLNTVPVEPGNVQVYGEGAELCYRAWPCGSWLALVIPRERVERLILEHFGAEAPLPSRVLVNFKPPSHEIARRLASELTDLTDSLRLIGASISARDKASNRVAESLETDLLLRMASVVVRRPQSQRNDGRARVRRCLEMLRDAMARVQEDPDECLDVISIASATNLSARSVQRIFQATCGLCPQEWLRIERLNLVHRELCDGRNDVTRAAVRWGFFHLGRFSRYYREVFGERPSETLRRARARTPTLMVTTAKA